MVLINNLTIDEINAALLHLQRSQGEIVGGNKGNTINNISVTQQGGGGYSPDFSSAIKNLEKRVDTLDVKTEQNQQNIAGQSKINVTQKDQISDLYNLVNNLRSSQITELFFDEDTRVLTLATTDARYDVPLPSEEVSLTFDSTSNKLVFSMGEQTKEVTLPYINASEKGAANGVATLDATGRVPYSQLPESAMEFKGEWNADTNTPTLKDGHGTNGDFYICNVGGTANFGTSQNPRTITFYVNDRVIYQGNVAQWKRLPASEVRTVNGQSGDVTLNGTNVKYSDANNSPTLKDKIDTVEGYAKTQSDWGQTDTSAIDFIKNKPSLATVATSGSYNDLSDKPTIPAAQIQSDWTQTNSSSKDFIKHKIPIWITSGSADDNMSPVNVVESGNTRPVTSGGVANALDVPTDAVLHYSFDNVPDYPDGTATYKNFKFTSTADWYNNNTSSLSVENGGLKISSLGNISYVQCYGTYTTATNLSGKILKMKFHSNRSVSFQTNDNGTPWASHPFSYKNVGGFNYIAEGIFGTFTVNQLFSFIWDGTPSTDDYVVIDEIYIGDGSYSTPIIDNANGQNNATNNGGIAVQGVSGKCVESVGQNSYIQIPKGNLTNQRTISFWIKIKEHIANRRLFSFYDADYTYITSTSISFRTWLENETKSISVVLNNAENYIGQWHLLTIVSNFGASSGNKKLYFDGVLISQETKSYDYRNISQGTSWILLNGGDKNVSYPCDIDDFQIFNRALSEQEVVALYLNKANTPKYYSWADWKLSQIS